MRSMGRRFYASASAYRVFPSSRDLSLTRTGAHMNRAAGATHTRSKRYWRRVIAIVAVAGIALLAAAPFFVPELRWRIDILVAKANGKIGDLSWKELVTWLSPGTGLYLKDLSLEPNP